MHVCVCVFVCVPADDNADQGHSMKLMSLWKADGTWGDPLLAGKPSSLRLSVYSLQQTSYLSWKDQVAQGSLVNSKSDFLDT